MHHDQLPIDHALVRDLVDSQFPQWAGLRLARFPSTGTENALYRLGDALAVRLPYRPTKSEQVYKERLWLPWLGPKLPLPIPVHVGHGAPTADYPGPWTILRWLPGTAASRDALPDLPRAARDLAQFILALRGLDTTAAPAPGSHNFFRGVPLAARHEQTLRALEQCRGLIDTEAAARAWNRDLDAEVWSGPPVWIHGDLTPANLLADEGVLCGVIDWGGLGAGDPATDLLPAWNLFTGESRQVFRTELRCDDATWARGRGLALSVGAIALPYYLRSNPAMAAWARSMIEQALDR